LKLVQLPGSCISFPAQTDAGDGKLRLQETVLWSTVEYPFWTSIWFKVRSKQGLIKGDMARPEMAALFHKEHFRYVRLFVFIPLGRLLI